MNPFSTTGTRRPGRSLYGIVGPHGRLILGLSLIPIVYCLGVLMVVARSGDIGLHCIFGTIVKEEIPPDYEWLPSRPGLGDEILRIGDRPIRHYTDYLDSIRSIRDRAGQSIEVAWRSEPDGTSRSATAVARTRPNRTYLWSFGWFFQEMLIFGLGGWVFWKRPRDDSARLFFWLCVVTVGAYMGGYHWTEIVVEPFLIYSFVIFAVFVPAVNLHFAMIFPRPNPIYLLRRKLVLRTIYGGAAANVLALWACMGWAKLEGLRTAGRVEEALLCLKTLVFASIGLAVVIFGLFFTCLLYNFFRRTRTRSERNQVRWVLLATLLSFPLIFYMLWRAWSDPARLGLSSTAWPMYAVSLLYTVAYALSITRYKLMQVEEVFNRGVFYVLVSVTAGLLYSGSLVLGALLIGETLFDEKQVKNGGLAAGVTAIAILILTGAVRDRFQKAIDRRFYREKYKFDQAMRKMNLAVGSLVDRETLGRRLLEAASEVLRVEWGAIYIEAQSGGSYELVACAGPPPDECRLLGDNPLVARLRQSASIRVPHAMSLAATSDPATDAMIALGGEAANALDADGHLAGLLVLGPKRSGLPYEDEELAFLGALSSVATLALHSAGIQQTLEVLNKELRGKVEKIADQQRRILILQDQLTGRDAAAREAGRAADPENREPEALPSAFAPIRGSGPAVRRMLEVARKVAASQSTVLIRGESGTGKELLAEAIHAAGPRAGRAFVKVHCAALSQSLLESELFGHVRSAFTGADRDRVGRFETAHGGTLFLDEIGDINLEVQTKLLRVLQEMSFERVGSSQPISVDVRILAATHQDLEALIRQGRFREDLFYRLNVFSLRIPSLRERKDDVFELAVHFLREHAGRAGRPVTHLDPDAVEALVAYDWPGNVRELENVIERAVVLADGPALTPADLPPEVRQPSVPRRRTRARLSLPVPEPAGLPGPGRSRSLPAPASAGLAEADREPDAFERMQLVDALDEARGNKSEAARLLGLPRSTFCSKLRKHGLL